MSSHAFQSLHTLLGIFSAVPALSNTSASDIPAYLSLIDQVRGRELQNISASGVDLEPLARLTGVPIPAFFIDCASVIAVASSIQCLLSNRLQASRGEKVGGLPQEETHLLVDLWGQVEASRALFEFVLRQSQQALGSGSIKPESLRAQYRVLLGGVEGLIVQVGTRYGERFAMAEAAVAIDWCLRLVRSVEYSPIVDALDVELSGLAV